jgi:hypothetical protein
MISGVIQKKVPDDALAIAAQERTQMYQFFYPSEEHLGPNFSDLWILTLQEGIPVAQRRRFDCILASESSLEIKEALQGGCK